MKIIHEVPFGERLDSFCADDNYAVLINVGTPPFTLAIGFPAGAMEAK